MTYKQKLYSHPGEKRRKKSPEESEQSLTQDTINREFVKNVWGNKYSQGRYSMNDLSDIMTDTIIQIEQNYPNPLSPKRVKGLLRNFKYIIPGGSVLFGIGSKKPVSISNCFVIPSMLDSYGGIFRTDEQSAQIMKRRGGVGVDLSNIRHEGSKVNNSAMTSTGVVPFADRLSRTTEEVAQDGRRGALMISIDGTHKDAMKMVDAKLDESKINGANISIKINNKSTEPLISARNNSLIPRIAEAMHKSAEPGILFWDTIIEQSPADCYEDEGFKTVSTNPCGELPLSPYSSCLLMHLVLTAYVDKPFTDKAEFLFDKFAEDVIVAQRIMDDLVDLELEKIEQIISKINSDVEPDEVKETEFTLWKNVHKQLKNSRRTGLGWMGLADTLAALGIKYDSNDAIQFASDIQYEVATNSYKSSIIMAKERGAFPVFNHSKEYDHVFVDRILNAVDDDKEYGTYYAKYGRRNISNLTIAPTGSMSILRQVSSGMEPVFELKYNRKVYVGRNEVQFQVFHHGFKVWYDTNIDKLPFDNKPIDKLSEEEFEEARKLSPYAGSTTFEIDPLQKIRMQGAIQKYNDHAVSVTHNVPTKTSVSKIVDMINLAESVGCKGFTLYREGSRNPILSRISNDQKAEKEANNASRKYAPWKSHDATKRPISIVADVSISTIGGDVYAVAIGMIDSKPYEVFTFRPTPSEIKLIRQANKFFIQKEKSKTYSLVFC